MKSFGKVLVLVLIAVVVFLFVKYDGAQYLSLDYLKSKQVDFQNYYAENAVLTIAIFMLAYIVSAALTLPPGGATILTLGGGALFGLWTGFLVVSFASTIGATLAFLVSRFVLRDMVQKKFGVYLTKINDGVERDGAFYLFSLRLIPVVPFFVINAAMGLTKMKTATYYIVSQLGMLAGTLVYVNVGTELSKIDSLAGVMSPKLWLSFILLGIFPWIARMLLLPWVSHFINYRKMHKRFPKPKKFDYNIIAIGAGAGGLVTSYIAAAVKAKVALIEKHKMGGDCLNTGCVPSKALIKSAKVVSSIKNASQYGITSARCDVDFATVMERVQNVVKKVEPHDSVERYTGLGVDCVQGSAKVLSPYIVEVDGKKMTTRNLVIATGARPLVPPIPGLDDVGYLTSDNVWNLRKNPGRLVVLGGGPIGCELAQSFHRLGAQVTQIEMFERIMGREDPEVSEFVTQKFQSEGVKVLTSHKALRFEKRGEEKFVVCEFEGREVEIGFDNLLLALGRAANTKGFGLEDIDVVLNPNKTVAVDDYMRSNYPNVYACGDVAGPYQFTHTAAHQAWYASVNALFSPLKQFAADYSVIPWCTYVDPEVARVGLNEADAKAENVKYEVTTYGIDDLDRAIAESEDYGFVKILTVPGKDKILGVTIVGSRAGDMIIEFVSAMKNGIGLNKILGTIHIYPTFAEANKYAAGEWKRAHTPEKLLKWVQKFHDWRRN